MVTTGAPWHRQAEVCVILSDCWTAVYADAEKTEFAGGDTTIFQRGADMTELRGEEG